METSPTTRKVVFSFLAIMLTISGLVLSQSSAFALTGFNVRSAYGYPVVNVYAKPNVFSSVNYKLPNGASINLQCKVINEWGNSWLKLTDNNYILQSNTTYPASSTIVPICNQTKLYPDRTLLQASGPKIYIIQSGKILWVPNVETLNTCLGGYTKVVHIADSELTSVLKVYPDGGTASCPVSYANGTTLLAPDSGTVYVIANGQMYGVPNPETLIACLGGWPAVHNISPAQMAWAHASYTYAGAYKCPVISYAQNTLLQGSGAGVYLVRNGAWLGIPNPSVLGCYGGWPAVHHVSDSEILRLTLTYPNGGTAACPYSLPEGSKLLAPNGTVFLLHNNLIFGMPNAETLLGCYGGWNGVRSASQAEIDAMFATYSYAGAAGCALPPPPTTPTKEQRAIEWAKSQVGSTAWNGLCELMVEQAFGTRGRYGSALANANAKIASGQMHSGDTNVPAGALAFFGAANVNGGYGHVMISIGNGQFVSNGYTWNGRVYGARITTIGSVGAGPYIGWAWADSSWPGR